MCYVMTVSRGCLASVPLAMPVQEVLKALTESHWRSQWHTQLWL